MKALLQIIVITAASCYRLSVAEELAVPDLGKVFPSEQLVIEHREGAIEWYLYETDLSFDRLKRYLVDHLGEGWIKERHPKAKNGVDAVFTNKQFPSVTVSLHVDTTLRGFGSQKRFANVLKSDKWEEGSKEITQRALLRTLAQKGDAAAQTELGYALFSGDSVERDTGEAIEWWRRAAEQEDTMAQVALGMCYQMGHGVPRDYSVATQLYHRAAAQGSPIAHYGLGVCYDEGKGVRVDHQEAVKHYLYAAERDHPLAQANLGISYYRGEGVEKNVVEAYAWLSLASTKGEKAQLQLEFLQQNLSQEEVRSGKKRAKELAKVVAARLSERKTLVEEQRQKQ
jgi:hypothetical protein